MQEAQFATLGDNTHPIEVRGSIDDCNRLVDTALMDPELNGRLHLTSANSLNLGRVLPQIIYFFEACARLKAEGIDPAETDFTMPCGNLSNVAAAAMARRMGAPLGSITGACQPGVFADVVLGRSPLPVFDPANSYPANLPRLAVHYCRHRHSHPAAPLRPLAPRRGTGQYPPRKSPRPHDGHHRPRRRAAPAVQPLHGQANKQRKNRPHSPRITQTINQI